MKNIIVGAVASLLLSSSLIVYAGKGKKVRKTSKTETCSPADCDRTKCQPNCANLPCCK